MPDALDDSDWFLVHPAFEQPRPAAEYWIGVRESDLQEWLTELDKEAEEAKLRASWLRATDWAVKQGADRVVVDVENEFVKQLVDAGFTIDRHRRVIFAGDGTEMTSALARLREVPRANVVVYRGDVELLEVRDMSWDSVFARLGIED